MKSPDEWNQDALAIQTGHGTVSARVRGSGPAVLLLHGFPTWSYDWVHVAERLTGSRLILPDLLGFGMSDKPRRRYSIAMQADAAEAVVRAVGTREVTLVAHDYGTIVVQELLDRASKGRLPFRVTSVALLNAGIIHTEHRARPIQRLLAAPVLGRLVARLISEKRVRTGLDAVLGPGRKLDDAEWQGLWRGISYQGGHRISHRLIHYIAERRVHGPRWEAALADHPGPLALIWGLDDPVSGVHVLRRARLAYPRASLTELPGVGHYPQLEAPDTTAAALRRILLGAGPGEGVGRRA